MLPSPSHPTLLLLATYNQPHPFPSLPRSLPALPAPRLPSCPVAPHSMLHFLLHLHLASALRCPAVAQSPLSTGCLFISSCTHLPWLSVSYIFQTILRTISDRRPQIVGLCCSSQTCSLLDQRHNCRMPEQMS
ncbi:hypothetical protein O6H91_21G071100 [Diphasiastrum complanatum]|uniref:Uncharacterized protein n=1 Tax=Diphasiastrum complanatum TaxID=34168 RepID=A0ACC2AMU8_DIPCM|nr:hypothetical protein O6H91_21G071100 [Diphasiastrum complanatum]